MEKSEEQDDKQTAKLEKHHCYGSCGGHATLSKVGRTCVAKYQCIQ
jgi:hypothetical protein